MRLTSTTTELLSVRTWKSGEEISSKASQYWAKKGSEDTILYEGRRELLQAHPRMLSVRRHARIRCEKHAQGQDRYPQRGAGDANLVGNPQDQGLLNTEVRRLQREMRWQGLFHYTGDNSDNGAL